MSKSRQQRTCHPGNSVEDRAVHERWVPRGRCCRYLRAPKFRRQRSPIEWESVTSTNLEFLGRGSDGDVNEVHWYVVPVSVQAYRALQSMASAAHVKLHHSVRCTGGRGSSEPKGNATEYLLLHREGCQGGQSAVRRQMLEKFCWDVYGWSLVLGKQKLDL